MPTYSYRCTECESAFDIVQSFTDDSLTVCPTCEGKLRKVFAAVGVTFNGSGFYQNDARADAKSSAQAGKAGKSRDTSSSGSGSEKPAPAKSEAASSAPSSAPAAKPASTPAAPAARKAS